jgi:hypothetical protein
MASSDGSDSGGGSTGEESTEESTESGTDTDDPVLACTTEWDCGIGERCLEGACACLGCACQSPSIAPATIGALDEDEVPIFIDLGPIPDAPWECEQAADCGPLEACETHQCVPTSNCVEDLDCHADWWPEFDRFCADGMCQPIGCDYALDGDAGCPGGSLCELDEGCKWLEVAPDCSGAPLFEELMVHALDTPESANVVILDVNVDGRDDIVVLENGFIYWFTSIGVGFEPLTPWMVEPGTQFVGIARGDVHADGVDELMVLQADPVGIEFLATGPSWPQWVGFAETMAVPEAASMMDVDYDGLPDLVTGTLVDGPMTQVEAWLGDGSGTFGPLWTEAVEPFVFSQLVPRWDDELECTRHLDALESLELATRVLNHEGIDAGIRLVGHTVAGHTIHPGGEGYSSGFLATAALVDRGALFIRGTTTPTQIGPGPGPIELVHRNESWKHGIIDHGVEMAEFVRLGGNPLQVSCRGSLGFALDAVALHPGDFDGDGRDDLLSEGTDGLLRAWLSRD